METLASFGSTATTLLEGAAGGGSWLLLVMIFSSVLLATIAGVSLLNPSKKVRQRITAQPISRQVMRQKRSLKRSDSETGLHRILEKIEKHVVRSSEKSRSVLRKRMIHAGYMSETAVRVYYLARLVLAISLPIVFLLLVPTFWPDLPNRKVAMITAGLCALGLYLPYRFIQSKIENRQRDIVESFPDALDLMVVCVEAGLGFDATLSRVSVQINRAHPTLATLLGVVGLELRAGKSRDEALQNLAMRSGVPDVSNFVTLIIQSEALGADLAQTLKVQAEEMRTKRMLRAEETAHKLPVKLSIPLVTLILPAMFAVVLGPGLISIARNVLPHLGH